MDPRPGKLKGFDDYLSLARKGLDFTPRADSQYRSFSKQLQSIFKHHSTEGVDTDRRRLPGAGRFRCGDLHAGARHGREPQPHQQTADQRQRQRHQDPGRGRNQPSDRQSLRRCRVELGLRGHQRHFDPAEFLHCRIRPEEADAHDRSVYAGLDGTDPASQPGVAVRSRVHDRRRALRSGRMVGSLSSQGNNSRL